MLPNFIGIGAPKAATTWVFHCLRAHPEVFITDVKETEYFSWRHTMVALDEYTSHFEDATSEHVAIGEISTSYLHWSGTPQRIHAVLPESRFFVSLRHPVDQVYSHYWHLRRQNFHQSARPRPESFEEALELYPEELLCPARYSEHLTRWFQVFDEDQIYIIFHDDIKAKPGGVISGLFGFLGVSTTFEPAFLNESSTRTRRGTSPRTPFFESIYTSLYDVLTKGVYFPLRKLIGRRLAEELKNWTGAREILENTFRKSGYPEMKDKTRTRLQEYYADDVQALESLTGRDLTHWYT